MGIFLLGLAGFLVAVVTQSEEAGCDGTTVRGSCFERDQPSPHQAGARGTRSHARARGHGRHIGSSLSRSESPSPLPSEIEPVGRAERAADAHRPGGALLDQSHRCEPRGHHARTQERQAARASIGSSSPTAWLMPLATRLGIEIHADVGRWRRCHGQAGGQPRGPGPTVGERSLSRHARARHRQGLALRQRPGQPTSPSGRCVAGPAAAGRRWLGPGDAPGYSWLVETRSPIEASSIASSRKGRGLDYPFDGGTAKVTGHGCCDPVFRDNVVPRYVLTGNKGAVRRLFRGAELAIANHEQPVTPKADFHGSGLRFSGRPELTEIFTRAGIDFLSLANNHIRDYGADGIKDTAQDPAPLWHRLRWRRQGPRAGPQGQSSSRPRAPRSPSSRASVS